MELRCLAQATCILAALPVGPPRQCAHIHTDCLPTCEGVQRPVEAVQHGNAACGQAGAASHEAEQLEAGGSCGLCQRSPQPTHLQARGGGGRRKLCMPKSRVLV